jgi:molybdate transport system substrate-binding protein
MMSIFQTRGKNAAGPTLGVRSVSLLFLSVVALCLPGCGKRKNASSSAEPTLTLYCGAGIRPAAVDLIKAFEKKTGVRVDATYAGSGRLLGQLAAAKRGDLFMPGSEFYADMAIEKKLAIGKTKTTTAYFIPVIFVAKNNPLDIRGLKDFAEKKLRFGLGDEKAVAIGRRAKRLFEKNNISLNEVKANQILTSGTVNELCVAIQMGNIDAAIVWDADAKQFEGNGEIIEIPPEQNIVSAVPIVRLAFSANPKKADAFIAFAVSDEGRAIFKKRKYTVIRQIKRGKTNSK